MSNTMQNWVLPYSLGCIAFEGDNLSHRLEITTDAAAEWQFKLDLKLGNTANVIDLTREGDLLYVDLTSDMTAEPGEYQAQLRGISGDKVRHSTVSVLYIGQSVNAINGFPATEPSEMAQLETRITVLKEAAEVAQKKSETAQSAAETAATSAADAADSAKAAVDALSAKADQPYQSSSRTDGGWYCADSAGGAPKEISLAGNSVQDGTPMPDAPVAVQCVESGTKVRACGKNLLDLSSPCQLLNCSVSNGIITQTIADTAATVDFKIQAFKDDEYIGQLSSQSNAHTGIVTMPFTWVSNATVIKIGLNGTERDTAVKFPATFIPGQSYLCSLSLTNETQGSISWNAMQIELGSSATAYEPYQSGDTITLGRNLHRWDRFDPLTGVYTVGTGVKVFDGTENWNLGAYSNSAFTVSPYISDVTTSQFIPLLSHFKSVSSISSSNSAVVDGLNDNQASFKSSSQQLWIRCDTYSDVTSFKAWLAAQYVAGTPVTVYYELAAPTTAQGTAQAVTLPRGVCNLTADSGVPPSDLSIRYPLDLQTYVNNRLDALESAVLLLGGNG